MRIYSLSITQKLLFFIIPLVCLPIIGVGYFSYNASINRVTRLLKEEQLLKAKAAASKINGILSSCLQDIKTMADWDLLAEFQLTDNTEYDFIWKDQAKEVKELFTHFIVRSPYYDNISLHHSSLRKSISIFKNEYQLKPSPELSSFVQEMLNKKINTPYFSDVYFSKLRNRYLIHSGLAFKSQNGQVEKVLVIDLDYSLLMNLILTISVGEKGSAFLVDKLGRTIAHPEHKPYDYDFTKYDDPRLREFIIDMISGETGWKTYSHFGEKAAAIAPVTATGWSLAVSIPIEEFKSEAKNLRSIVIQTVVFILIFAVIVLSFISYRIVNPIKRLVSATEQIGKGDLLREIPVTSGGELGVLTHSFNSMIRSLRNTQFELIRSEKLNSMGKLSAGVAHEIRNPLNAMKGAITYLKKHEGDNPIISEYSQLILEEVNHLSQFVSEFLHYSKLSAPKPILTNVNDLIENTLFFYSEEFHQKGTKVFKRLQYDLPQIRIDTKQIEQVLVNIIINAIDALPLNGSIEVKSYFQEQTVQFSSQSSIIIKLGDNGSGISDEYLKNIFDPFFSTKEDGTGLGLPISLNIIESHGGTMKISSQVNVGTEVVIILPVEGIQTNI